jgi:hypothetical protein
MNEAPHARVRFYRLGARMLAAGMLVASVVAVASVIMHLPKDGSASTNSVTSRQSTSPWGVRQAGYRQIDAPVARALGRLPLHIRLPGTVGRPTGVYSASHSIRVRYGRSSRSGVYLVTVWGARYGVGPRAIRTRASACRACTQNRLIRLTPRLSAAVAAGGGHPSIVTWREGGRTYEVRGPAATFSNRDAVSVARAIALANA